MALDPVGLTVPAASAAAPVPTSVTGSVPAASRRGSQYRVAKAIASFMVAIFLTYLGLLAVTFFIGRVMPIDPVLAIVGDRAPEHVIARVR